VEVPATVPYGEAVQVAEGGVGHDQGAAVGKEEKAGGHAKETGAVQAGNEGEASAGGG
jgi:hypothetical protein